MREAYVRQSGQLIRISTIVVNEYKNLVTVNIQMSHLKKQAQLYVLIRHTFEPVYRKKEKIDTRQVRAKLYSPRHCLTTNVELTELPVK